MTQLVFVPGYRSIGAPSLDIGYRAGSSASAATATVVCNKPAGVVDGDVLLATIQTNGAPAVAPAGWVLENNANTPTGAAPCYLYSKIAASEPSSWTFGKAGGSYCSVLIDSWYGVNNSTPMDVAATVGTGTAATVTFPNITSHNDNAWHYASWADDGGTIGSTPATYTARSSLPGMSGYDKLIALAGLVTGVTKTGGTSWVAFSAALRPASAGGSSDPQIFWTAGMEGGNLSEWGAEDLSGSATSTAVTGASQSITAHGGSWVMKQAVTGSSGGTRMNTIAINSYSQAGTTFYASAWLYFPFAITFGSSDQYMLWQIASYGGPTPDYDPIWALYLDGNNPMKLKLIWSPSDLAPLNGPHSGETGKRTYTSTPTVPTGQWVFIEIKCTPAGATDSDYTGALKIWMNGTVLWDLTLIKTRHPDAGGGPPTPGLMYTNFTAYGSNLTPTPAYHYVDDVTYSLGRLP